MNAADLIYGPLVPLYDVVCGALLQPGRRVAMSLLAPREGERILEVGVGTGYAVNDYPPGCCVMAIDLSLAMLERTLQRVDADHRGAIRVAQADAAHLPFAAGFFDAVYVPYTINCVPDPIAVGRELRRVCRPGGRMVFLNHFDGVAETSNAINALAGRIAAAANVQWHLHLDKFLEALNLRAQAVASVNLPRLSSVVLCQGDHDETR